MAQVDLLKMDFMYIYLIPHWKETGGNNGEWEDIISNPTTAILSYPGATWVVALQGWGRSTDSPS